MTKIKQDLYALIKETIEFPQAEICKHYIAASLLNLLEQNGEPITVELAKSVVQADDEKTIEILSKLLT
mgnify:CR=1 FL=1